MHRETVFLIDDDPSVRDALMLLLSLRGHVCAAFASAEDFLAALQPGWRGCVVADIRMSGMSGLQLQADGIGASGEEAMESALDRLLAMVFRRTDCACSVSRNHCASNTLASRVSINRT